MLRRNADGDIDPRLLHDLEIPVPHNDTVDVRIPIIRVVVDGRIRQQFSWPPDADVFNPSSPPDGPLICRSSSGILQLRNVKPSIAACLSQCQRLPVRVVKANEDMSGPAGFMQRGSVCMLLIYGKRSSVTPDEGCSHPVERTASSTCPNRSASGEESVGCDVDKTGTTI
jgi:hypothetical protein